MRWPRLWRRRRRPSPQLLEAERKYAEVARADQTIGDIRDQIAGFRRRNRLGPMVDKALRGKA